MHTILKWQVKSKRNSLDWIVVLKLLKKVGNGPGSLIVVDFKLEVESRLFNFFDAVLIYLETLSYL